VSLNIAVFAAVGLFWLQRFLPRESWVKEFQLGKQSEGLTDEL
jgi:hypothetical protein